jgi:hypothetical protein
MREHIGDQEIEAVLSQHWKPEKDEYGWVIDASPEQCVWIENGNEDIDTCPDSMIKGAARALGNPLLKPRSRIVLMFDDSEDDVGRNTAWYVAQAFGARWAAVLDDVAGRLWPMDVYPPRVINY